MQDLEKCTTNKKTVGGDMDLKVAGASPKRWSRIFKMSSVNIFNESNETLNSNTPQFKTHYSL